jgi:predicted nucleic acid-binding protein
MRRRDVFVDATFIRALLDAESAEHVAATSLYDELTVEFVAGDTILHSHAGMVKSVDDARAAAVMRICNVVPLRRYLLREADRVIAQHPELQLDRDRAVALVMIRREHIREIASFDPLYERLGVRTFPAHEMPAEDVVVR